MADFEQLIDLASERLGGAVAFATDDFFAPKENLLKPGKAEFIAGKYTENGKWMDGWESRRRRDGGHDWCLIRLGLEGVIRGVDVDTSHFLGNAPRAVRLEGLRITGYRPTQRLVAEATGWSEILPESAVKPGSQNLFALAKAEPFTHLKLHLYPDGGVARLRVYGEVAPDWSRILQENQVVDLAAVEHGGTVVAASDEFFSDRRNLILPGTPHGMHDGWETRRRRGPPGHDWVVLKLGRAGELRRTQVDTSYFKGNFPESCSLEGALIAPGGALDSATWRSLLPRTQLEAHARHGFELEREGGAVTHVRMNIFPDGGVARLRLYGVPSQEG